MDKGDIKDQNFNPGGIGPKHHTDVGYHGHNHGGKHNHGVEGKAHYVAEDLRSKDYDLKKVGN